MTRGKKAKKKPRKKVAREAVTSWRLVLSVSGSSQVRPMRHVSKLIVQSCHIYIYMTRFLFVRFESLRLI